VQSAENYLGVILADGRSQAGNDFAHLATLACQLNRRSSAEIVPAKFRGLPLSKRYCELGPELCGLYKRRQDNDFRILVNLTLRAGGISIKIVDLTGQFFAVRIAMGA